jgi:hypothetical protein
MYTFLYKTNNIRTLYSIFEGNIININIRLDINIENEKQESSFRYALFRKAEEFFRYNNPHKFSFVCVFNNCENSNITSFNLWHNNLHENLFLSYMITIELDVEDEDKYKKLVEIDNCEIIMKKAIEECDKKKFEYIENKKRQEKKVVFDFDFDYTLNYL